jgi:hypothetical protein
MQSAPSQISPGESFDLFYFIRNHTDGATYYVRARIYDVRTGALLDTQDLAPSSTNTRLFLKTVQAPADPTGYGRSIVSIATVYTDSGYSTKSDNYEEQEQYFLVKTVAPFVGGGGSIDLGAFRDVVEKVVEAKLAPLRELEPLELPEVPFDALFGAIGALQREVNRVPKESTDLSPVLAALARLEGEVQELPRFEATDLSGVLRAIQSLPEKVRADLSGSVDEIVRDAAKKVDAALATIVKQITADATAAIKEKVGQQQLTIPISTFLRDTKPEPLPTPQLRDVSHLF